MDLLKKKSRDPRVLPQAFPYLISFEITKRCNYRCTFCYQSERINNEQDEMTVDEIVEHFIPQVDEMHFKSFCFIGAEPLLRFDDIIELAPHLERCKHVKDVQITTNGYLLTEEKIDAIMKAYKKFMLTFAIPLDSVNPATVRSLRPPKKDVYERSIESIKLVVRKGLYMSSGMVACQQNFDEIDAVGKKLKEISKDKIFRELYPMFEVGNARNNEEDCLNEDQLKQIDRYKIENYGDPVLMWDNMPFPVDEKTWDKVKKHAFETDISRGCSAGNNYFNVDHAGNIYPCNFLEETILGNVMDGAHEFKRIWDEHPVVQRLRNRDVEGKCGTCKYRVNCGGCRSRAYVETGDIFGGVESCDGSPDGHPLELIAQKNVIKSYKKYRPLLVLYKLGKRLRLVK